MTISVSRLSRRIASSQMRYGSRKTVDAPRAIALPPTEGCGKCALITLNLMQARCHAGIVEETPDRVIRRSGKVLKIARFRHRSFPHGDRKYPESRSRRLAM